MPASRGGDRGADVLGSQAIAGAVDTIVSITTEKDEATGAWVRYVTSTNRAGEDVPRTPLVLEDDAWITMGQRKQGPPTMREMVIEVAVRYGPDGITKTEVSAEIGMRKSAVIAAVDGLIDEGKLVQHGRRLVWHEAYDA